MDYIFTLRQFCVNNLGGTIKAVEIYNYKLSNSYLFYIFMIIPFFLLKCLFIIFNIRYIYLLDNIYLSNYGNFRIIPIIINVVVFNEDNIFNEYDDKTNISTNIKNYTGNIPIWYIIENENLNEFQKIKFKFFSNGKMEDKIFNLTEINNNLLYEIF